MNEEILTAILVLALLSLIVGIFIHVARKLRNGGGSMTFIMFGATDEFYNKEQKRSLKRSLKKAGKKTEEQSSSEPKNKTVAMNLKAYSQQRLPLKNIFSINSLDRSTVHL